MNNNNQNSNGNDNNNDFDHGVDCACDTCDPVEGFTEYKYCHKGGLVDNETQECYCCRKK